MNTPTNPQAALVTDFLNAMYQWEIYMEKRDKQLDEEISDDMDEEEEEELDMQAEEEMRAKLRTIFDQYLHPSVLETKWVDRLLSLSYSIPPEFRDFQILDVQERRIKSEVIVKLNNGFQSILKYCIRKVDDVFKIEGVYWKTYDGKWKKNYF